MANNTIVVRDLSTVRIYALEKSPAKWHREDGPAIEYKTHGQYNEYWLFDACFARKEEWEWCVKNIDSLEICTRDNYDDPLIEFSNDKLKVEYMLKFGGK